MKGRCDIGLFSNGTEGRAYQAQYCDRCQHDQNHDCPVWFSQQMQQGEGEAAQAILDRLIPRTADGCGNERCRMFVARAGK